MSQPFLSIEPYKYKLISMVEGEKHCYDVGLTTWPKPLESIESKVGAYGDEIFGFMGMHVNTKA